MDSRDQARWLPLIVQREGKTARLWTRNGYDWSRRFPLITEAALRNRQSSFVIDGEAVLLGDDGRSDFDGLHSRQHDEEVQFYAFDMLVADGEDIRKLPLSMRKASLTRLLARRVDGIFLSDFEQGQIGPDLFRHACIMGLEEPVTYPAIVERAMRSSAAFAIVMPVGGRVSRASGIDNRSRTFQLQHWLFD